MLSIGLTNLQSISHSIGDLTVPPGAASDAQARVLQASTTLVPALSQTVSSFQALLETAKSKLEGELRRTSGDSRETAETLRELASLCSAQSSAMTAALTRLQQYRTEIVNDLQILQSDYTALAEEVSALQNVANEGAPPVTASIVGLPVVTEVHNQLAQAAQKGADLEPIINAFRLLTQSLDPVTSDMQDATKTVDAMAQNLSTVASQVTAGASTDALRTYFITMSTAVASVRDNLA
ncbi:hypothetical protein ACGFX8_36195 [Streptomyces sp. NPDC048362]|uniref:hypothetical protein n=1 Tax=Streptomyces sp. NPDC048362 TaxID=3365539 RepID=UPI003724C2FF